MLIGDLPFYVAQESSLVWSHQDLFMLGENGELRLQSGVPKEPGEPFEEQFWGHPLYDWEGNSLENVLEIFYERLEFLANFCDLIRIDHANGFFRYGIMSREHPAWNKKVAGPDKPALLRLLQKVQRLGIGIYFEDIASETMRLEQFMKEYEVAGTSVLTLLYNVEGQDQAKVKTRQLALDNLSGNKIIFSSTHDTPTLISWVKALPAPIKKQLLEANNLGDVTTDKGLAKRLRDMLLELPGRLIVIPWQDWQLETFRFNVPGHEELTRWDYTVPINKYL